MKLGEYVDLENKDIHIFTVSYSGPLLQGYAPFKFSLEKALYRYSS